jgi:non-specific serine/threonine protein kinase/serine/threonine-protein kinase
MNQDREFLREVEGIFEAVVGLDNASRVEALAARCGNRQDLRAEVEGLLEADARVAGFMEPPSANTQETLPNPPPGIGSVIGPFRLVTEIGAGGMGTIYLAERADGEFAQRVAVKIIALPMSDPGAARRFRAERQILASLRHPNIVNLLDGGVTPDGYAYLVMEYVEGVPVAPYCADRALTLTDRLRLFRTVCAAVHYAHRHGVVHRDLKPANILVASDGAPKVLDFGVAKMLDKSDPSGGTATSIGPGPLTPNYASPEQLRGVPLTTSSDVYALGVLLYELVAGVRPYETEGKPLDDVVRIVVDSDPPRPSSRNDLVPKPVPYDRARALKGDVDAIVLRAIAKQPEDRYGSAEELSEDIGRFLGGVPVIAREPSFGYVMRKLARRHKAAFVSAAVSFVLIVAALLVAISQARVATIQRRRAEARFEEVRQLASALIFEIHDAVAPLAGSTGVRRTIVERALAYLERLAVEAQGDPALQVDLSRAYVRIGKVQGHPGTPNLGDRKGAIQSFRKAQALVEPLVRSPNPLPAIVVQYVDATRRLSESLLPTTEWQEEALRQALNALTVAEDYHRLQPTDVKARNLIASSSFTVALAQPLSDQLTGWQRTAALYDALLADSPDDPENQRNAALAAKYLGAQYHARRDLPQALRHYQRALDLDEGRLAHKPSDRSTQLDVAIDLSNVGGILQSQGNSEAVALYERSLTMRQALADSDPKDVSARSKVAFIHKELAHLFFKRGELRRALEHGRRAISLCESLEDDRANRYNLAETLRTVGSIKDATRERAEACAAYGRAFTLLQGVSLEVWGTRGSDLGRDVAARAAQCGHKAATEWLARESSQSRPPVP